MEFSVLSLVLISIFLECSLCIVRPCPFNSMCTCKPGTSPHRQHVDTNVSCLGVPFSKLPEFPHSHMEGVSIVASGLQIIQADSFGDMKADSLSLMSNRIVDVHDHAFLNMYSTLESVDMSSNNLQEVPFALIKTLEKLKVLNLESNEIPDLPVTWMHLKDTLVSLYLRGNDLTTLPSRTDSLQSFINLTQIYIDRNSLTFIQGNALPFTLRLLSISENFLTEIPYDLINNLPHLTQLYLRNNYIGSIPTSPLTKRRKFVALDLSYNYLKSIDNIFFRSVQIEDLNLQGNFIESITPAIFNGVGCNKIDLSYNSLNSLTDRAFYGLESSLNHLDLGHNNLTKIPKAILGLKNLNTLILDYNPLPVNYPDNLLKNCSQYIKTLSLVGTGLKNFPKNILKNTKKIMRLDLSNNLIESIEESDFQKWGEHLNILHLKSNRIKKINDKTFKSLKSLEKLSLAYNQIELIEEKAFVGMEQLTILDLSYALKTYDFPEFALKPLSSLIYLALTGNDIKTLSSTAIYNFHYLQHLLLDFNKISEIPESFFHAKIHSFLTNVRLSFNDLVSIGADTFNGLEELQNVVLNDNQIAFISQGSFKNLPSALKITLSNNHITLLRAQTFVNIPNLIQLDLQNNELKEFSFNIFQNVTNSLQPMSINLSRNHIDSIYASEELSSIHLKTFDLSSNKLTRIPQNLMISIKDSLRRLDLGYNQIRTIESNDLWNVKNLEILNMNNNGLLSLKRDCFSGLNKLQILDLSNNFLEILHPKQFANLVNLRILDLSYNVLRSITDDAFHNTKIEKLILKNNVFVLIPSTPFVDITYTLRVVDFSSNQIEQLSRELFSIMPSLNEINLCNNKLAYIHPNEFKNINSLIKLDICGNKLSTIGRHLFQHVQNLRYLNLAEANLNEFPTLSLPNLMTLNLSKNNFQNVTEAHLLGLPRLRHLDLSHNRLSTLHGVSWYHTPHLKSLNVSNNPIKILTKDSFSGLSNLIHLNIQRLDDLERFDSDTLQECKLLKSLRVQTWPRIEKYRFRLARIISNLKFLQHLSILFTEEKMTDQLVQAFPKKLISLEITGDNLKYISENSLEGLEVFKELTLRISGTKIKNFPKHLFWKMKKIKLSLELTDNHIEDISPELFYVKDGLQEYGTSIYTGISLEGNPILCGCHSMWFSGWMKRHLYESSIHFHEAEDLKSVTCLPPSGGRKIPLLTYTIFPKQGCEDTFTSDASTPAQSKCTIMVSYIVIKFFLSLNY